MSTLTEHRKSMGLSQTELARAVGLKSPGSISDIENGKPASVGVALRIEAFFKGKVAAASLCPDVALVEKARGLHRRPMKKAA